MSRSKKMIKVVERLRSQGLPITRELVENELKLEFLQRKLALKTIERARIKKQEKEMEKKEEVDGQ